MALHTNIQIIIGNTAIQTFDKLLISQAVNQHHFFELHCRGDAFLNLKNDIRKQFNGKEIFIRINTANISSGYQEGFFKGIVNHISENMSNNSYDENSIIFKGMSPTILLDSGDHYCSFSNKNLSQIANKVLKDVQQNLLSYTINPIDKRTLPYIVQYKEGGFQFISRMAQRTGEWCYYNGEKLILGEIGQKEILLTYGDNLLSFSMETHLMPAKTNVLSNNFINNQVVASATTSAQSNINGYNKISLQESESLFMKETTLLSHSAFSEDHYQQELDAAVKIEKSGKVANMLVIKGKSDNPDLCLGSIVSVQSKDKRYGKFIITKLTHQANGLGEYENKFEGISAAAEAPPYTSVHTLPHADKQIAIVTDNHDPKNMGRIRARFPWQEKGEKTPWMRVATPHAGAGKGFHFLPEIGEEVLIDFEGKNAEKPFVTASFYHGKAKPEHWSSPKNNIKAIRTRSGHLLRFDDSSGKENITITDKNGNTICLSAHDGTINISAPNKISITSKDINIHASRNLNISGEKFIKISSLDGEIESTSKKNTSIISHKEKLILKSKDKAELSSDEVVDVTSKKELILSGGVISKLSGGKVQINRL